MSATPRVLCFGYPTLNPWDEFLRGAGCQVNSVWFAEDIIPTLSIGDYDVAVISNKLEEEERRRVAKLIRERQPGIALVFLQEGKAEEAELADALVDTAAEPDKLLAVIRDLLPRRGVTGTASS